ncbi:hypothetical protein CHL9752_04860 [Campylobacter hyointestinalis subsp. lawsonii]|nr:hypothetical protein CHL9752_04860 [Campylobacter hyointestinalis subsp. lawsonii]
MSLINLCKAQQLLSFFKGLGVVKGEGVATAKKASPFPLKFLPALDFADEQSPSLRQAPSA